MKKYSIINDEKYFCLSILKRYIEVFEIDEDDILNLILCEEDKNKVLDGSIFLPDVSLKNIYKYFNVSNYDELYDRLQKRIEIKNQINKYNPIKVDEYIFDEKDFSFIYTYYKYLSKEEKIKMANDHNTTVTLLLRKFTRILNGNINAEIFKELLDKYNVKKLSELKKILEKINLENKKQRIIEKMYKNIGDDTKQSDFNKILEIAMNKYKRYNIDIKILEDLLYSLNDKEYEIENQRTLDYNLLIENYIINEIKNKNIDYQIILIDENKVLKRMILKNSKYDLGLDMDKLYEDAVEKMILNYDSSKTIDQNILVWLKYLIENYGKEVEEKENNIIKQPNNESEETIKEDEKIKETFKKDKGNELIIRFVNKYLKETNMSKNEFAKRLKINRVMVINYLNKKVPSRTVPDAILKYFNLVSINELENKLNEEEKIDSNKTTKEEVKNDIYIEDFIILLEKYLKETNMSRKEFATALEISKVSVDRFFEKENISEKSMKKILRYFEVNSTSELETKIDEKIEKYKEEHKDDITNDEIIELIKKYMESANISRNQFAEKISISKVSLDRYITGVSKISKNTLNNILQYFEAKSLNELKEKMNQKIEVSKIVDIKSENIQQKKFNINHDLVELVNIDILNNIMRELLKRNKITSIEYMIFWLLFKGNNGKQFKKEEISEFLEVEEHKVTEVYLDSLKIYRNYFDSLLQSTAKIELKNLELKLEENSGDING